MPWFSGRRAAARDRFGLLVLLGGLVAPSAGVAQTAPTDSSRPPAAVTLVTDEADQVLALLGKRQRSESIVPADWETLFASSGYRRLQARERSLGRSLDDSTFQTFVLSDSLLVRAAALTATLAAWRGVDLRRAARRALAYLPPGPPLRARLYLVIKPRSNSFVFETATDPAIFIYIDPRVSPAKLENTLAHELHHVGYAAACTSPVDSTLPARLRAALDWMGAFGEGWAMLAGAGGPSVHPHAESPDSVRRRWDADVVNAPRDLLLLQDFFLSVLEGRLADPDSIQAAAMEFFGLQGPWYTVGWKMAVAIETTYGRERLIGVLCDPRAFLRTYNDAARGQNLRGGAPLPLWSDRLMSLLVPQ